MNPKSPPQPAVSVEDIIAALKQEQDRLDAETGDYLMDANDCINVILERFSDAAPPADCVPDLEALGEKLFILSDHLRRSGVLSDAGTHIAYEDVVGEFQKLSAAPKAPTAPIGEAGGEEPSGCSCSVPWSRDGHAERCPNRTATPPTNADVRADPLYAKMKANEPYSGEVRCPQRKDDALPEGCPACGALPCDWANDPEQAIAALGEQGGS